MTSSSLTIYLPLQLMAVYLRLLLLFRLLFLSSVVLVGSHGSDELAGNVIVVILRSCTG